MPMVMLDAQAHLPHLLPGATMLGQHPVPRLDTGCPGIVERVIGHMCALQCIVNDLVDLADTHQIEL